jgi:hypothetical protein
MLHRVSAEPRHFSPSLSASFALLCCITVPTAANGESATQSLRSHYRISDTLLTCRALLITGISTSATHHGTIRFHPSCTYPCNATIHVSATKMHHACSYPPLPQLPRGYCTTCTNLKAFEIALRLSNKAIWLNNMHRK